MYLKTVNRLFGPAMFFHKPINRKELRFYHFNFHHFFYFFITIPPLFADKKTQPVKRKSSIGIKKTLFAGLNYVVIKENGMVLRHGFRELCHNSDRHA
jgi:hypothetical protein